MKRYSLDHPAPKKRWIAAYMIPPPGTNPVGRLFIPRADAVPVALAEAIDDLVFLGRVR